MKTAGFLLGVGSFSLLLAFESVRIALTARVSDSSDIAEIRKAISWDPANPQLHFLLGTVETYNPQASDPSDGIRQFELATRLSPRQSRYWRALASACEFEGNKACARRAVSRSLALSPMTPRVRWEAANYYLWANDLARALSQFQRLLELDADYAGRVLPECLRVTDSPEVVYHDVLPPSAGPKLKLQYINFLVGAGREAFAFQVWNDVAASRAPFKFSLADPYLERLIGDHRYQQAMAVWRDLEQRDVVKHSAAPDPGNLIFNGGFERTPLNAGFDWRYQQQPYVGIDFRGRDPHQGSYCLRLDFTDVENHQDEPVYQLVPVAAGQTYVLSAYFRSANLSSGSGPRLRVTDPACPACLDVSSEQVVGTTGWHKVTLDFRAGAQTDLVRVSVWRPRSLDYPTEILGTLWVDQVSLAAAGSAPDRHKQKRGA